jgi:hypothetical protein
MKVEVIGVEHDKIVWSKRIVDVLKGMWEREV